ncbi:reverse transcriptase domain-containing protein [Tanacetum coccineum]|uniref:Reverse transcriptase domain-containing protein n=1 Tax=Tanacetum coccineum TaxID=301880 RepID=A0ABQ5HFV7_9ASTR
MIDGNLYCKSYLSPWLRCVGSVQAKSIIQEIHQGSREVHAGSWSVVSKIMKLGYYWPSMHNNAKALIQRCEACQIHSSIPSYRLLHKVGRSKTFSLYNRKARGEIRMGTYSMQIRDPPNNHFRQWETVSNGHMEVTNRDIVKGMERRLGKTHHGWVDELPRVLWAHKTTPKSSNGETPFILFYGFEADVPIEISVETKRIKEFEVRQNEKRRREDLDILEEQKGDNFH